MGSLHLRARRVAVREGVAPSRGGGLGVTPRIFFEIFDAKYRVWGQFYIGGQPNEYDVICQNASVLAFHLWPTIFAGAPLHSKIFSGTAFHHVPAPLHPWLYAVFVSSSQDPV